MFEFMNPLSENDAISILKKDHDTVKALFEDFKNASNLAEKKMILDKTLKELRIHTVIEEEIFYPALRRKLKKDLMNEANEEHHVAKLLVAELSQMTGKEEHFDAKYHVLAESVRHHIREEEDKMFPEARGVDLDYTALGEKLTARKESLQHKAIPKAAEDLLMERHGKRADSPAATALKHSSTRKTTTKAKARRPAKETLKTQTKKMVRGLVAVSKRASKKMVSAKKVVPLKQAAAHKKQHAVHAKVSKVKKVLRKTR